MQNLPCRKSGLIFDEATFKLNFTMISLTAIYKIAHLLPRWNQ